MLERSNDKEYPKIEQVFKFVGDWPLEDMKLQVSDGPHYSCRVRDVRIGSGQIIYEIEYTGIVH